MLVLRNFTTNSAGMVRNDTMEGKDFTVVPMVMLVEGVHAGSDGPLYYPAEELAKIPAVWNHKPVVVYHPQINGQGVSACDPEVLTTHKIGVIMNTVFEDGKLKAEAWLDMERVAIVDNRIAEAIENNETLELSTGLFTDTQQISGTWNGEDYSTVAINYRPDHLAVLPDQKGACSIEDGAGFLRLNKAEGQESLLIDITKMTDEHRKFLLSLNETTIKRISARVENELSFDDTRRLLYSKLEETVEGDAWIEEVYEDFFIYESNGGYMKQSYTIDDGKVSFNGLPEAVKKKIEYVTLSRKDNSMKKAELIQSLIDNALTKWTADDKETLDAMDVTVLNKLVPEEPAEETKPTGNEEAEETAEEVAPVGNEETKPQTAAEYIEAAPVGIREVLTNAVATHEAQKASLVAAIVKNEKCSFTKEQLMGKGLDELKAIGKLAINVEEKAPTPEALYLGQADPVANTSIEEPLEMPTMNFGGQE